MSSAPLRTSSAWLPYGIAAALVLAAALAGQQWLGAQLAALDGLAPADPEAACRGAEALARGVFRALAAFALVAAALFARGAQLALRERRIPPRGAFSWGAPRIVTGPAARRRALVVIALAAGLAVAGVATLVIGERRVSVWSSSLPR